MNLDTAAPPREGITSPPPSMTERFDALINRAREDGVFDSITEEALRAQLIPKGMSWQDSAPLPLDTQRRFIDAIKRMEGSDPDMFQLLDHKQPCPPPEQVMRGEIDALRKNRA